MPDGWLIALPCWGKQYRERFARDCWPSWQAALLLRDLPARLLLHTDDPTFADLFRDVLPVEVRPPPARDRGSYHNAFANAHREALRDAKIGEIVAIQNADHILSVEAFAAAERRFRMGKKLIMCAGVRTVGPLFGAAPPVLASADLLQWAMHHAHTITQQSTYPNGQSGVSSVLYFQDDTNTVMRAWHLHPFAVLKDRELDFAGTVDRDLPDNFTPQEIHVVTSPHELAQAEISPPTRHFALRPDAMTEDYLYWWGCRHASDMHWHFFKHRIVLRGSGETHCDLMADRVLARRHRAMVEAA